MLGGELVVPPGRSITVTAPLSGTLLAPVAPGDEAASPASAPPSTSGRGADSDPLVAGSHVRSGDVLLSLLPLLPPEARASLDTLLVEAQGAVQEAEVELEAARIALERAEEVFREGAGSRRAADEARARYDLANAALEAAQSRLDLLETITLQDEAGELRHLEILAPLTGILEDVWAVPGQRVTAGAPLFRVSDQRMLWVRVPIYAGDVGLIDLDAPAIVEALDGAAHHEGTDPSTLADPELRVTWTAERVGAPPSADPQSASVHLYYEIENAADGSAGPALRAGERVSVHLQLTGQTEGLVVPRSAVLQDIQGGRWVYVRTGPRTYVRRRVEVRDLVDDWAVLARGLEAWEEVVTSGAVELFGEEFGVGH